MIILNKLILENMEPNNKLIVSSFYYELIKEINILNNHCKHFELCIKP